MMVKNESRKTQKLIIPHGTIDPNDTTVIEIPTRLQNQPVVVAKRKDSQKSITFDNEEVVSSLSSGRSRYGANTTPGSTMADSSGGRSYRRFENVADTGFSSTLQGTGGAGGSTFVVQRAATRNGDVSDQTPTSARGPFRASETPISQQETTQGTNYQFTSKPMPAIASQMSGRFNFQTNVPSQTFRITCEIEDESAEVDEIEKAERQLILGELQKYHEARRKYLNSFCESKDVGERIPPFCVKPAPCRPISCSESAQQTSCEAPAPKSCPGTSRADGVCRSHHRLRESSATCVDRGTDASSDHNAPAGGRQSCLKMEEAAGSRPCIPTILTNSDIVKIRQQFQEATKRLEKAMSCLPCNSKGRL